MIYAMLGEADNMEVVFIHDTQMASDSVESFSTLSGGGLPFDEIKTAFEEDEFESFLENNDLVFHELASLPELSEALVHNHKLRHRDQILKKL
jgi:hypothetical protein